VALIKSKIRVLLILGICQVSVLSHAFIEQVMSFEEKYETSVGIFSGGGTFSETHDEAELEFGGTGLFGELRLRRAPWLARLDTYSFKRETQNGALSVKNDFREFKVWGIGSTEINDAFSFYGGLGAGLLMPATTISSLGNSKKILSKTNTVGGLILGLRWSLPVNVFFDLWGHTVYAPVYPTGNVTSVVMAMGYRF
jgi:hypothetical protein